MRCKKGEESEQGGLKKRERDEWTREIEALMRGRVRMKYEARI